MESDANTVKVSAIENTYIVSLVVDQLLSFGAILGAALGAAFVSGQLHDWTLRQH